MPAIDTKKVAASSQKILSRLNRESSAAVPDTD